MRIARVLLAVLPVLAVAGCAKEPPEDNYQSLKDQWTDRTTVAREGAVEPEPVKVVYTFPPPPPAAVVVEPARPAPPAPPHSAPMRREPPSLAISPPKVEPPPPPVRHVAPVAPTPPPAPLAPPKALTESDLTNCGLGADCLAVLRAMIADSTQSWMVRAPTPQEFANGTRLFAYRALKSTLECGKLRFANAELDWAVDTFKGGADNVEADHRARVAALAEAVRGELTAEIKKRC